MGKSRSLAIIGGEWYGAIHEDIGTKDFKVSCHRVWLADMDELSSMQKKEAEQAKSIASTPSDIFRMPYASVATERKRRFVLAGTTNETDYLSDTTGNRRYMPVECRAIDTTWIADNRDQLFAEALVRYRVGEPFWNLPAMSAAEQTKRLQLDPWHDVLTAVIEQTLAASPRPGAFIASSTLFWHCGVPVGQQNGAAGRRLTGAMRRFPEWKKRQVRPRVPYPVKQANGSEVLMTTPMHGYVYEP
jgi:putative DNA primase/helicase